LKLLKNLLGLGLLASLSIACGGSPLGERTITVPLEYEGTDFGPDTATGTAVINTMTGQVDITVTGLDILPATDEYEGWLAGGGEDPQSTAKFSVDASGNGTSTITLGDISESTYERVVLTVEPVPDPSPGPDPRHSIGGNIPAE